MRHGGLSLYTYSNSGGFFPNRDVSMAKYSHVKSESDSSSSSREVNGVS